MDRRMGRQMNGWKEWLMHGMMSSSVMDWLLSRGKMDGGVGEQTKEWIDEQEEGLMVGYKEMEDPW